MAKNRGTDRERKREARQERGWKRAELNLISEKRVDIYRLFRSRDPKLPFVGYARYVSRQDTRVHLGQPWPDLSLSAKYSFLLPISQLPYFQESTLGRSGEKNWILSPCYSSVYFLSLSLLPLVLRIAGNLVCRDRDGDERHKFIRLFSAAFRFRVKSGRSFRAIELNKRRNEG